MIQRPQSLYLLIGALLLAVFVVLAESWALATSVTAPWLSAAGYTLSVATAVVALGAIFLYRTRDRQRTVISVAQWLCLALVLVVAVGLFLSNSVAAGAPEERYLVALLPLVAYVMLRMARRGVQKDVDLVRSMDRLR